MPFAVAAGAVYQPPARSAGSAHPVQRREQVRRTRPHARNRRAWRSRAPTSRRGPRRAARANTGRRRPARAERAGRGYAAAMADFQTSPRLPVGSSTRVCARSTRARRRTGMLRSGATLKAEQTFGTGLADQEFTNYYNRLFDLSKLGESAASGTAQRDHQRGHGPGADRPEPRQRANQHLRQRRSGHRQRGE